MLWLELLAVAAAGLAAGASNAIAGAGSLITFPTMVALGVPQLSANVTNTIGLVPGAVGGSLGYADELADQRARLARLAVPSLAGAAAGTALLLVTPGRTFELVVPGLIAISCVLLLFQPQLATRLPHAGNERSPLLTAGLLLAGAYAAYFGSAVGILLLALLTLFITDSMQRLNGVKNVLAGAANLLAAVVYAFLAPIEWSFAVTLMVASLVGGVIGARIALRVSGDTLRVGIAIAGLVVAVVLAVQVYP
jgi:uncharacterized protein